MGSSRTRSRSGATITEGLGGATRRFTSNGNLSGSKTGSPFVAWTELCQDVLDNKPYPDHPLVLTKRVRDPIRYNGKSKEASGLHEWTYSNMVGALRNYPSHAVPSVDGGYWTTKALANANPNRPDVDIPVFIFELKDLPRMIRQLGDVLRRRYKPSDVAGGYLAYSFGWRPLFSDLYTLLNMADAIEKRKNYLNGMSRGKRVKRSLGKFSTPAASEFTSEGGLETTIEYQWTTKVWFTCRIKADLSAFPNSNELHNGAMRAALGLNLSASQIWEIIPWSWFIDYMANVGDVLAAQRNFIPWRMSNLNVMALQEMRTSNQSDRKVLTGDLQRSGGPGLITAKRRFVATHPSPVLRWSPFLTGHQTAILGSLLTASALRPFGRGLR